MDIKGMIGNGLTPFISLRTPYIWKRKGLYPNIDKIREKYLPISITLNAELDQFGNQGPVIVSQSKEERLAKAPKTYLGNVKLVWTNGEVKKFDNQQQQAAPPVPQHQNVLEDDLPF